MTFTTGTGSSEHLPGWLALLGGSEWTEGCEDVDSQLLRASGGAVVLVLPTAAAYEHPDKAVATASAYFARLGARAEACMVLSRSDAEDGAMAATVRAARFIYLGGGSVLHLRSVLKNSAVWDAMAAAWRAGAVVAGSSAGAMVLGDTMVDPRGGALTLGPGPGPAAGCAAPCRHLAGGKDSADGEVGFGRCPHSRRRRAHGTAAGA